MGLGIRYVYLLRNTKNGKRYIGTSADVKTRFYQHMSCKTVPKITADVAKYGKGAFEYEVLEKYRGDLYDFSREKEWVYKLQPEYNSQWLNEARDTQVVWMTTEKTSKLLLKKTKAKTRSKAVEIVVLEYLGLPVPEYLKA